VIAPVGHATRAAALARATALVTLGALAVHQLRYAIAFGGNAGHALATEGHGYLADVLPPLVAVSVAAVAAATVRRALTGRTAASIPVWRRAALYAAALVTVFACQELIEGALAAGHPTGVAAVLGDGAWVAIPLALAIGVAAALVSSLLDRAEERIQAFARSAPLVRRARSAPSPAIAILRAPLASLTLAFGFARRPPPLVRIH
jgi:hypothetical protein